MSTPYLLNSVDRLGERRPTAGTQVIRWIEATCVYTAGPLIGQPVRLLRWQKRFILWLFSLDAESKRIYRWALLGMPKKNGKTELAAWLGLYFLIGDDAEPAPHVVCAAASEEQADLVYGACRRCVELSPVLADLVEPFERVILVPSRPGAELRRVAASAGTNDGKNSSVVIIDELHEWTNERGRDVWNILTNGVGARPQPMILQITTAGVDVDTSLCGEQYQFGKRLALDPALDPRYLFWWYEPPESADWRSPETWRQVNPSWGATLPDPLTYLQDQQAKKTESVFRRYFCNQWVLSENIWLPWGAWDRCQGTAELEPDRPLYVGIDGALKRDSFAIVAVQPQPDDGNDWRYVTRAWIWENPYPRTHAQHAAWRLNLQEPMNRLRALREEYPLAALHDEDEIEVPGPAFGYDPFMMELVAQQLRDEGLNMIEVPQTDARMMPGSEAAYRDVTTGRLVHDGEPVLRRHVHGAVPKEKDRGWRIGRARGSARRIDGAVALVMAEYLAHLTEPASDEVPSVW